MTTAVPKPQIFFSPVCAGFPSPASEFAEKNLDLNTFLIKHPEASFFVRVQGNSMKNAFIRPGDILVVDRAIEPVDNAIIIAFLDGEFTVKRIRKENGKTYLIPENPRYRQIEISAGDNFEVWGTVTYIIHSTRDGYRKD